MLSLYEQHLCAETPVGVDMHRLWTAGWSTYLIAVFTGCTEAEVYNDFFGRCAR